MGEAHRNIELKAADPAPDDSRDICERIAIDHGVLLQRDTYFEVRQGGLKLREQDPGTPHLIQFERPDEPQERQSKYRILEVTDADDARSLLGAALGIRVVVEKRRQLFVWNDVRIHLDEVTGLGSFIELEAVASPDSDLRHEHSLIRELRHALGITDERLIAHGYAHQLLHQTGRPQ